MSTFPVVPPASETDPLSLHLDQTTPQSLVNGIPLMTSEVDFTGSGYQLANKNYVDLAVSSINIDYFLLDAALGVSTYKNASTIEDTSGTPSVSATVSASGDNFVMGWITPAGEPIARKLIKGIYEGHIHATKDSGARDLRLRFTLVERKTDNSEVTILASELSDLFVHSDGEVELEVHGAIISDYALSAGSRLVCKWWANLSGAGNVDLTLYYQGTTSSHFAFPTNVEVLNNVYLRLDQSVPQSFTNLGGGTGLMKVTAGLLGLDTSTYLTSLSGAWLNSTDQTGLTGDKSGSFNLLTTGTLGAGAITGTSLIKSGGTSSQFLKADGTVDSNAYYYSGSLPPLYVKRVTPDFGSGTSFTPNANTTDIYEFSTTAVAGTLTVSNPTGSPTAGQALLLRVKTTNTQTYAWDTQYRTGVSIVLPTTTSGSSLTDYVAFIWNSTDSMWDLTGISNGH